MFAMGTNRILPAGLQLLRLPRRAKIPDLASRLVQFAVEPPPVQNLKSDQMQSWIGCESSVGLTVVQIPVASSRCFSVTGMSQRSTGGPIHGIGQLKTLT